MVLCVCLKRSPRVHEPRNATWHWRCIKRAGGFAYAESRDGLSWDKPNLGRTEWPAGSGDTANNLLSTFGFGSTGGCGTGVVLDVSSGAIGPVQPSRIPPLCVHINARRDRVAPLPPCSLYGAAMRRAPPLGLGVRLTLPCVWNNAGRRPVSRGPSPTRPTAPRTAADCARTTRHAAAVLTTPS